MGDRGALVCASVLLAASLATGVAGPLVLADPPVTGNPGGAAAVVAGNSVTCAVVDTASGVGTVKCFGYNFYGQLGRNNKTSVGTGTPSMESLGAIALGFDTGDGVVEVALGGAHACARSEAGAVICWGHNADGQLGIGSALTRGDGPGEMAMLGPLVIGAGRLATRVVAGDSHSCILSVSKDVTCWGYNGEGQLGLGDTESRGDEPGEMAALGHVALGGPVSQVVSGSNHVCALTEAGDVVCWGDDTHGQLGRADPAVAGAVPLPLAPGETVSALSAGGAHTCALTSAGDLHCWGRNNRGQLGLGDTESRGDDAGEVAALAPVPLPGAARAVSAGFEHTCAVLDDDSVRCWGNGTQGRLGYGNENDLGDDAGEIAALAAVPMAAPRHGAAVSAGKFHTCLLRDNGTVVCWGDNAEGQLGQGDTQTRGDGAGEVASLPPVVLTPPAVELDAVATTSTTANAVFDLVGDEPIDCATVSDTFGVDLAATSASAMSVAQHAPDTCRITVVSTVPDGELGEVSISAASGFAVADATGQVARTLGAGTLTVTIDRVAPVTSPTTSPTTTTTTTTVTTTTSSVPLTLRVGRSMRITRVLNRAAVSAASLARVWVSVRPASKKVCALAAGKVRGRRVGRCRLTITVVGRGGATVRHGAVLRVIRR